MMANAAFEKAVVESMRSRKGAWGVRRIADCSSVPSLDTRPGTRRHGQSFEHIKSTGRDPERMKKLRDGR